MAASITVKPFVITYNKFPIICYFGVIGRRSRLKICFRYGVWVRVPEVVFESIVLSFELFGCTFVYEKDCIVLLSPPILAL